MNIIYLHGFRSSKESSTVSSLRAAGLPVICETFDHESLTVFDEIETYHATDLLKEDTILIGASNGGAIALYLSEKYKLPVVLINPRLEVYHTLSKYGVSRAVLDMYALKYPDLPLTEGLPREVILGISDTVISPAAAGNAFRHCANVKHVFDGHRLTDYTPVLDAVLRIMDRMSLDYKDLSEPIEKFEV